MVELHGRPRQLKPWSLSWCPPRLAIGTMHNRWPGTSPRSRPSALGAIRVPGAAKVVAKCNFGLSRHATQLIVFGAIVADPRQLLLGRSLNLARLGVEWVMPLERDCRDGVMAGTLTVN